MYEDKERIPKSSLCSSSYNKGAEAKQRARVSLKSSCSAATGAGKDGLWGTATRRLIDSHPSERDTSPSHNLGL